MNWSPTARPRPIRPLVRVKLTIAGFILGCILSTIVVPAFASTIYKSVDKDGKTIFTDQPLEGAETLSVDEETPNSAENPDDRQEKSNRFEPRLYNSEQPDDGLALTPEPENPPKSDYQEVDEETEKLPVTVVEILTPIHDATLHDPIGQIWVELQSYPTPLKKTGLLAELWMDDVLVSSGKRPMLSLPTPERGTHVLVVKLVNDKGQLILKSDATHIHVKHRVSSN